MDTLVETSLEALGKPKMAKKKQISIEKRAQIEILHKKGMSERQIAKELKVSRNGVHYSLVRKKKTGDNLDRKRSGRRKVTTAAEDKHLRVTSRRNRKLTASDLRADLNSTRSTSVSLTTVKRRLRSFGLFGRVAIRKPLLRPVNKKKRLAWAKAHKNWTFDQWKTVLWSDESKFDLFAGNRRQYVRRMHTESAADSCIVPTVKHGGGSVMVWGCFGGERSGDLIQIKGIMNKEQYHSILQRHAIPSGLRILGPNFTFQQDNDPKHTSKLCQNYLKSKETQQVLKMMIWPPQSPDLSPIELAWDELDRKVRQKRPSNEKDLFKFLKEAWEDISGSYWRKLLQRLPRVCAAVIKAKGGYFNESRVK